MNVVTFRVLKHLVDANRPVRRSALTTKVLTHVTKNQRQRILRSAERNEWIEAKEVRRVEGAGPPAIEYVVTEKGVDAYTQAASRYRDGVYSQA